ncbi:DNA-binding domain-containing protein [Cognatilysobacter bugurensis]|uniref:DUF2063 domain-containing protein n=1 Tax=Cognatilysobacter bugurensis TaxID=543356 RepID=A0A918W5T0_9GAMM|nr:putative DNA-binding domain-containing protein [Lysobacter bugurensis]GHA75260.1 DUF2063 domain-containing protein [Lysobacter bugurensis]
MSRGADTCEDGFAAQRALTAHIRDPQSPPPDGIEARRLRIYQDLFFNNVEGVLAGNFPVMRRTLGDEVWTALARGFVREHPSRTPLFTELAREFMRYLDARSERGDGDPPWLVELAHYEWVELALQISEARIDDVPHESAGDLLDGRPALSPLAWPLAYVWPVHRIGPGCTFDAPPPMPTLLLVQRAADGSVTFSELSPLAYRLLARIEEFPRLEGRAQLRALAGEAGVGDADVFVANGAAMLDQFRRDGVLLGTLR